MIIGMSMVDGNTNNDKGSDDDKSVMMTNVVMVIMISRVSNSNENIW